MQTLIGKHYREGVYDCAHYVAEWYSTNCDIQIPVDGPFDLSFVRWLRKHFKPVKTPQNHDLVLMVNRGGGYHVGVFYNGRIYHNFKPAIGHGSVCDWSVLAVKSYYKKVVFGRWSQSNISQKF